MIKKVTDYITSLFKMVFWSNAARGLTSTLDAVGSLWAALLSWVVQLGVLDLVYKDLLGKAGEEKDPFKSAIETAVVVFLGTLISKYFMNGTKHNADSFRVPSLDPAGPAVDGGPPGPGAGRPS